MKHKAPNRLTRTSAQVEGFLKLHGVEKKAAPRRRRKKAPPLTRKERRKQERLAKKQKKTLPKTTLTAEEDEEKSLRKKAKNKKKKVRKAAKKKGEQQLEKEKQDKELEDQKREEAAKYDNYVIKNLEKQLHLKKKNNSTKLPSAFVECGLADLLDAVDPKKLHDEYVSSGRDIKKLADIASDEELESEDNVEAMEEPEDDFFVKEKSADSKAEDLNMNEKIKKVQNVLNEIKNAKKSKPLKSVTFAIDENEKDINNDSYSSYEMDEEYESEPDSEDGYESNDEEHDDNCNDEEHDDSCNDDSDEDGDGMTECESNNNVVEPTIGDSTSTLKEDIYGRLRDIDGNVVSANSTGKYIPPAKRLKLAQEGDSKYQEKIQRVKKLMKGQINRLSEANMQPICSQIESIYQSNSRAIVNEVLAMCILEASASGDRMPERLIQELVMLVAILHSNVGSEVGAFFLQQTVKLFEECFTEKSNDKSFDNVLVILANLYNFKVIHSTLLFDVFNRLLERFGEEDVEGIIVMLKNCGFTLRKADAVGLKDLMMKIQAKATTIDTAQFKSKSRMDFMLEILMAIKNNNMRKIPNYDYEHLDHLKKMMKNFTRVSTDQLSIKLSDLKNAESHGKWWLVGSAWAGGDVNASTVTSSKMSLETSAANDHMMELARHQRMNTDVRRNIFFVVMNSEDYLDAFEKLLRLGLKNQQEFEIIHVLFDLCLHEKSYNPFYSHLCQKFCEYHRRFQMTMQFSTWDKMKLLHEFSKTEMNNLVSMLAHLIVKGAMSLSLFKVVEFAELDKFKVKFLRMIFEAILTQDNEFIVNNVFEKISQLPKLATLREGIKIFMRHFILRGKNKSDVLLTERIEMAERILSYENRVTRL